MFKGVKLFLLLIIHQTLAFPYDSPVTLVSNGYIRGSYKNSFNGRRYRAFEGIPYAVPPVGNLRFEVNFRVK